MTTLSRTRRLLTLASASILVASAAVVGALPANAAPGGEPGPPAAGKVAYAALGDSYAAGVGGGEYLDECFLSPNGYAAQLASDPGNVHVALNGCIGATTTDVLGQLGGIDHRTRSITLTVGANDLGLAAVTAACLGGPMEACLAAIAEAQADLGPMAVSLSTTLATIRAAAPKAEVIVTGYPVLLEHAVDPSGGALALAIAALNSTIAGVVAAAGPGFEFVDVTDEFAGHGIGSLDPWIVALPALDAFHPNIAGHTAYADAIRAVQ